MKQKNDPNNYTVKELSVLLNVGLSTAYESLRQKQIPATRVGRCYRAPVGLVHRLLGISAVEKLTKRQDGTFRLPDPGTQPTMPAA